MKIVIAGAGEVGSHLAELLSNEADQDVTIIDADNSRLTPLEEKNVMTFNGNPTSIATLKDGAGVDRADLFIAVTPYETDNIVACTLAKRMGAKKTVARVDNYEYIAPENDSFFRELGVTQRIYPEYHAAQDILMALRYPWTRNIFEIHNGEIVIVGVKIRENAENIVNKSLIEVGRNADRSFHISAIKRDNQTIIPNGRDEILAEDIIYISTTADKVDSLVKLCGKESPHIENVIIMGGNKIAVQVANADKFKEFNIKIIEKDYERSQKLAELCPNCEIIHGNGRDLDLLEAEGIEESDAFIALSNNSEANILACITAKNYGVLKTIAEVENVQFINEADYLNIGNVINKRLIASSRIYQLLLDTDVESEKCMSLADAEIAEIVVKENAKITRSLVKDLKISNEITIAGLIRNNQGIPVTGNTQILPGDSVVVFYLNGAMNKVVKLFS
ncbi:MAG: Trk system potassium transporter TrkA [Muribaculaceae bacterium]|nr:Trk system potassium transporter TrkA [Muribaculaceae bacterium]